ncbi:MAG: hypothetical protein EU533_05950 [Promethearchaeota archaeon]|nr:MAG: hypothetical protein EU533_05950 [Candidatus Lokiarchaeota archaeon]
MNGDKKYQNSEKIKDLVVFKEEDSPKIITQKLIVSEEIDQDEKIKLIHELRPFGATYKYTVLVANQSQAPISEAKIKIRFPKFMDLNRYNPHDCSLELVEIEEGEKQINIQTYKVEAKSQKQYSFFLTPLNLESEGEFRSFLTFVNNQDFLRALDSKPLLIRFNPITIERKILPTSQIKSFSESPQIKRGIRSIGIALNNEWNPNTYFNLVKKAMEDQNYQLITNVERNKIAWYFGTDLVSGNDVLVVIQIVKNKIEWIAVSNNQNLNISVLSKLVNEFVVLLIFRQLIETPHQVYNLECKKCGAVLPYFPEKGEQIKCKNCKVPQIVWL